MMQGVDPARSRQMSLVRHKNTKPEMMVRQLVHALGYRFRLHRKDLPGKPDLVFPSRRAAVFVHGCFWHQHPDPECRLARMPKSRQDFWRPKLEGNRKRDERNIVALEAAGWRVLIVWECQIKDSASVANRLAGFLNAAVDHPD